MIASELTNRAPAATSLPMQAKRMGKRWLLLGGALALSACVSVNAPDKPIVIELNINIKQEVIYKLAADAGNTIQENSDIF
jgi:YnbE-like lipoprotein